MGPPAACTARAPCTCARADHQLREKKLGKPSCILRTKPWIVASFFLKRGLGRGQKTGNRSNPHAGPAGDDGILPAMGWKQDMTQEMYVGCHIKASVVPGGTLSRDPSVSCLGKRTCRWAASAQLGAFGEILATRGASPTTPSACEPAEQQAQHSLTVSICVQCLFSCAFFLTESRTALLGDEARDGLCLCTLLGLGLLWPCCPYLSVSAALRVEYFA